MQLLHFGCWWYSYGEVCKKFSGTRQVSSTYSPAVYPKKASTYDMHRDSAACTFSASYQKIRDTFDKTLFIGHTATKRGFLLPSLKQPFLSSTVWFWRKTKTLILSRPYVAGIFWVACAHLLPRGILDYQGTSLTNEPWSDKGCLLSLKFDWSLIDETWYFVASHRVQTTLLHLDLFVLRLSIVRNGHLSIASRTEVLLRFRMKLSHSITTKEFQASNFAFFFFPQKKTFTCWKVTLPSENWDDHLSVKERWPTKDEHGIPIPGNKDKQHGTEVRDLFVWCPGLVGSRMYRSCTNSSFGAIPSKI